MLRTLFPFYLEIILIHELQEIFTSKLRRGEVLCFVLALLVIEASFYVLHTLQRIFYNPAVYFFFRPRLFFFLRVVKFDKNFHRFTAASQ